MPEAKLQTAAVIGTGMMGPGITATLGLGGVEATILSRTGEGAGKGLAKVRSLLGVLKENELAGSDVYEWAVRHIRSSADFDETISRVDLVIESAPEDMALKQDLFARMDSLAKPDAVLTTNTSGLSVTEIASKCSHPERVLATHFWNPPHLMPLVEVVRGEKTSGEIVAAVRELLEHCGKSVVVVQKDRPGQLGNRMQHALIREAVNIVGEGIACPEDVDLAARMGFGLRLPVYGVLEHMDIVGLDMGLAITDYVCQDLYNEPRTPDAMRKRVERGDLGAKTGKGFYDWTKKDADEVRARRNRFVVEFLKSDFAALPRKTGPS